MSIGQHIQKELKLPASVVQAYLSDLSDDDLFVRPHPKANHIAWQLGHLIAAEHDLNNMVCPDSMPALPEGFKEQHSKETAGSDDKSAFRSKDEYVQLMNEQRAATLALLDRLSDEELEKPAPEKIQQFGETVGTVLAGQSAHWMMHAGQWVIVRRILGKEPLF